MKKTLLAIVIAGLFFACSMNKEKEPAYKNPKLDIEKRTEDLLSRMTLEEKFWQMFMIPGDLSDGAERYKHGIFGFQVATKGKSGNEAEQLLDYSGGGTAVETAELINSIQQYFVEETRLGIPIIAFDEALHGLVREGATAFPQSIALASTFDTTLMGQVAEAIALETKSRGIRQILSPVLNIARDVRWGRTEETYGEDPYLTTQMGLSFISKFEQLGVITTPKHFIANVGDGGRDSYPIHFTERYMEEVYFPAFKAVFQEAGAWSVMTSYNSYDGSPCTANNHLLNEKLKKEWGFQGFVISDAGATGGANVLHFTTLDYAESTKESVENGLDVIFQTSYDHYPLFFEAYEKGMIDPHAIDEAVRRVLRAKFKLGLFESPYVDPQGAKLHNSSLVHRELAEQAALKSLVLLKNENHVLPLDKENQQIALIGPDAMEARLGGYSGPGNHPESLLEGIQALLPENAEVRFAKGPGRGAPEMTVVPSKNLVHHIDGKSHRGLKGEYYNNIDLTGKPVLVRSDSRIDFRWTLFSPDQKTINYDYYSASWTGALISDESGEFNIGLRGDDGYRLYLDGRLIIDNWAKQSFSEQTVKYKFTAGQHYEIKIEFFETVGNVWLKLIWDQGVTKDWKQRIQEAVHIAEVCDVAVVAVGIEEGEFRDRAYLGLPGKQEELILALAETGKPVVVLLYGGSAIIVENWYDQVDGILNCWYPGDAGGSAVAKVLYGDFNPAGRLPITYPKHEAQLPLYYSHKPTGRGDDYLNLSGKPRFPFGYGLSYTQFDYSNLQFETKEVRAGETVKFSFELHNSGSMAGEEVVQVYLKDLYASVARPIYELKAFQRVHLKPGESKTIQFNLPAEVFEMLDKTLNRIIEPGAFRIMIGSASNNIKLRENIEVI